MSVVSPTLALVLPRTLLVLQVPGYGLMGAQIILTVSLLMGRVLLLLVALMFA